MPNDFQRIIEENLPTVVEKAVLPYSDFPCLIKRDDLIHPAISGNKWRKLKGYLTDDRPLITCGGLHSNHLFAFAYLAGRIPNKCYAIIRRSDKVESAVVSALAQNEVECLFLDRLNYRQLRETEIPWTFFPDLPQGRFIPEGGKGEAALSGLAELGSELNADLPEPSTVVVACGTGTTVAGLRRSLSPEHSILAVKLFEDGGIERNVESLLNSTSGIRFLYKNTLGKFAERHKATEKYIVEFYKKNSILLEPIYNGRMICLIDKMISEGEFKPDQTLVLYHCGGLSGISAYLHRYPDAIEELKTLNHPDILRSGHL